MKKDITVLKHQTAIQIYFNKKKLRNLLNIYSLEEVKQIGCQLVTYSLDAIGERSKKSHQKYFIVKDTDLYY